MANQYPNYNFSPQQYTQPIFPQPQGTVYIVNNSLEIANIPMGVGVSAIFCFQENLCYLKTMQNGNPVLKAYKIIPNSQEEASNSENQDILQLLKDYDKRIQALEMQTKKGGSLNELL